MSATCARRAFGAPPADAHELATVVLPGGAIPAPGSFSIVADVDPSSLFTNDFRYTRNNDDLLAPVATSGAQRVGALKASDLRNAHFEDAAPSSIMQHAFPLSSRPIEISANSPRKHMAHRALSGAASMYLFAAFVDASGRACPPWWVENNQVCMAYEFFSVTDTASGMPVDLSTPAAVADLLNPALGLDASGIVGLNVDQEAYPGTLVHVVSGPADVQVMHAGQRRRIRCDNAMRMDGLGGLVLKGTAGPAGYDDVLWQGIPDPVALNFIRASDAGLGTVVFAVVSEGAAGVADAILVMFKPQSNAALEGLLHGVPELDVSTVRALVASTPSGDMAPPVFFPPLDVQGTSVDSFNLHRAMPRTGPWERALQLSAALEAPSDAGVGVHQAVLSQATRDALDVSTQGAEAAALHQAFATALAAHLADASGATHFLASLDAHTSGRLAAFAGTAGSVMGLADALLALDQDADVALAMTVCMDLPGIPRVPIVLRFVK